MKWRALITCEHASASVPDGIELGVSPEVLRSHVAWDPGASEVAQHLARSFALPLLLGRHTRLVTDLNRNPDNPEVVPVHAFGVDVPGNAELTAEQRQERIERLHAPYWSEADRHCRKAIEAGNNAIIFSIHSFTDNYEGEQRDVEIGLLVDPDHPLEGPFTKRLHASIAGQGFDVRVNEPYDGRSDALVTGMRTKYPTDRVAAIEIEMSQKFLGQIGRVQSSLQKAIESLELDLF